MERIVSEDLKPMQVVLVESTISHSQGFVGKLFKVLAIDHPYAVLLWLESVVQSKHSVDLRQFSLLTPSRDYVAAICPSEDWAETIEEKP